MPSQNTYLPGAYQRFTDNSITDIFCVMSFICYFDNIVISTNYFFVILQILIATVPKRLSSYLRCDFWFVVTKWSFRNYGRSVKWASINEDAQ